MNPSVSILILSSVSFLIAGCNTMSAKNSIQPPQEVNRAAELNTKLGVGYMREGKYELAWNRLNKALKTDGRYAAAHNAMALLYEKIGRPEKAREHYTSAITYSPTDSSAHNNFGGFLCRAGELEAAKRQYELALDNPLYATPEIPYTNLGLCLHQSGQSEDAERYLRKALELNPRIPGALSAMSDISFIKGETLSARAYMQRYMEVGKQSSRTLWLGVRIERALGDLNAAASYAMLLKSNYPDSDETRLLLQSESQWQ